MWRCGLWRWRPRELIVAVRSTTCSSAATQSVSAPAHRAGARRRRQRPLSVWWQDGKQRCPRFRRTLRRANKHMAWHWVDADADSFAGGCYSRWRHLCDGGREQWAARPDRCPTAVRLRHTRVDQWRPHALCTSSTRDGCHGRWLVCSRRTWWSAPPERNPHRDVQSSDRAVDTTDPHAAWPLCRSFCPVQRPNPVTWPGAQWRRRGRHLVLRALYWHLAALCEDSATGESHIGHGSSVDRQLQWSSRQQDCRHGDQSTTIRCSVTGIYLVK